MSRSAPLARALLGALAIAGDATPATPQAAPPGARRIRRVAVVLVDGAELLELLGPARILDALPGFVPYTVAATRAPVHGDLATVIPDWTFDDAPPPDVIVVSSGGTLRDRALSRWLRAQGPAAGAVLSVCNGALALAAAGLLDGRAATCPDGNLDELFLLGRDVRPLRDARVVRDGNTITCDSYFAGVDGALEVARLLAGEEAAQAAARSNLYDWRPDELARVRAAAVAAQPSHQVAILKTVLASGVDAGLAQYREWEKSGAREPGFLANPGREELGFHIVDWTLEAVGRADDAIALATFTAKAFPRSAEAVSCLGEAYLTADRLEEALSTLLEAQEKQPGERRGLESLETLLHRPDFVANDEARRARTILREHATRSSATLAPPGEPGTPIAITGVVRDAAGKPVAGALLHVFHADATGCYTPTAEMDEPDARLFAFLRSDEAGRYSFRSVRPGAYRKPRGDVPESAGDERWIPQHIHFEVEAAGHAPRRFQLVFRDDPRMTPHWLAWAREQENPVIDLVSDGAGTLRGSCEIVLR